MPDTTNQPNPVELIKVPKSLLGIFVDHRLRMRAIRRAAKDTKHGINMAAKKARTNIRLSAAAAELPAGRGARVVYRANQVNDLANAAVGIATAVVAMQQAYRQLRTTPMSTPGSTNEYNPQEDPPF